MHVGCVFKPCMVRTLLSRPITRFDADEYIAESEPPAATVPSQVSSHGFLYIHMRHMHVSQNYGS